MIAYKEHNVRASTCTVHAYSMLNDFFPTIWTWLITPVARSTVRIARIGRIKINICPPSSRDHDAQKIFVLALLEVSALLWRHAPFSRFSLIDFRQNWPEVPQNAPLSTRLSEFRLVKPRKKSLAGETRKFVGVGIARPKAATRKKKKAEKITLYLKKKDRRG